MADYSGAYEGTGFEKGIHSPRRITVDAQPKPKQPVRSCPNGAAVIMKGEWYPCDMMDQMSPICDTHDGWPHGNMRIEAIWQ